MRESERDRECVCVCMQCVHACVCERKQLMMKKQLGIHQSLFDPGKKIHLHQNVLKFSKIKISLEMRTIRMINIESRWDPE